MTDFGERLNEFVLHRIDHIAIIGSFEHGRRWTDPYQLSAGDLSSLPLT
jgi:hypothetical protein